MTKAGHWVLMATEHYEKSLKAILRQYYLFFLFFQRTFDLKIFIIYNILMTEPEKLFELYTLADTLCSQPSYDMNLSTLKLLFMIKKYSPAPASLLLSKLGLIKTNLSASCLKLETEGYIISKRGKEDKRSRVYTITEKGEQALSAYFNLLSKLVREDVFVDRALEVLNKKV